MGNLLCEPSVGYGTATLRHPYSGPSQWPDGLSIVNSTVYMISAPLDSRVITLMMRLNGFRNLTPNWDSYGAEAPDSEAVNRAQQFIWDNAYLDLPYYFTGPGVNGEVMLEFQKGDRAAELYFNPDGTTELVLFVHDEVVYEEVTDRVLHKLMTHFR
ncbi:MAG: hypothetical protein K9J06_10175 [Flavobacteriales bacterium]|nr:hypothetical protein [Flavobacteriales bacterium]